ncbi:reductive dehalogenase [Dehalogenimonas etheniformans]|uniref:Reductive dehalogenase n=2 Tax=Dehalogenimonas etheniformans TaxID=1536648 RepID=A0A2P5P707_9CHLR|nr:reductive dehalogenase [Dehalogenimonas etheniformans]PPD58091.1 reductive dehalogenase [Dehalogenimonas etheniformans]QNT77079.1 reductive dehalogenase [Dehalogenimonas etheniformans]
MKALGVAGAGIGGAAMIAPTFHDLDELASSGELQKHPWYIKERERLDPTPEIDWNVIHRYDRRYMGQCSNIRAKYYGKAYVEKIDAESGALQAKRMKDNVPGFGHKWEALRSALSQSNRWSVSFLGPEVDGKINVTTPEGLGVPKWQGTPEENSKMVVAAIRLFGMAEAGFNNLDSTWRTKLVAKNEKGSATGAKYIDTDPADVPASAARPIVYEDVAEPYYTKEKWVVPTKDLNVMYLGGPEPRETDRTYPSRMSKSNLVANSGIRNIAYYSTYQFFRALGYNMFGGTGHGTDCFNTPGVAVFTGKAEAARMANWVISPAWGPRSTDLCQITDMPLAETHPIDAGVWRFCQTCGICADSCPSKSIQGLDAGEASYEMPPINGKPDTQHVAGIKRFYYDGSGCRNYVNEAIPGSGCSACAAYCTFSTGSGAIIHSVLKSTISYVPVFNGFLANMGRTFGYGAFKDPEEWWDSSLPQFGINSTLTAEDGGYRK